MSGGFRSRSKSGDNSEARTPQGGKKPQSKPSGERVKYDRHERTGGSRTGGSRAGRAGGTNRNRERQVVDIVRNAGSVGVDLPRAVVYETLLRVHRDDAFANLTLPKALRVNKLDGRDAAFATELTYGTLRAEGVVDAVIAKHSSRGLDSLALEVLDALRLGTYQLLYTRVEQHAAVDTTVRLVQAAGHEKAKGFVNGIMRSITRANPQTLLEQLTPDGEIAAIAFRHAHPEWIAQSFSRVVGLGDLEAALEGDSQRPIAVSYTHLRAHET